MFFRALGLNSRVEAEIEGVRGKHSVDVYVEGTMHAIPFKWIVECKAWSTNIPKEKVLALAEIVDDVGADRGFLLSEVGFQSGAVLQSSKRNITLTSLQDLREVVNADAVQAALSRLTWRAEIAKAKFRNRYHDEGFNPLSILPSPHWFYLDYLSVVIEELARNRFPILYKFDSRLKIELIASTVDELISGIAVIVSEAEASLAEEDYGFTILQTD